METRTELLERRETLLREKEEALVRLRAEVLGLREEVAFLRRGVVPVAPVADLTFSDAVVEVLLRAGEPLAPREIYGRLVADGRQDNERSLGGILQALRRRERVEKVGRGRWRALP
jgi:hypothetical protein